jgi:hypothetical protein
VLINAERVHAGEPIGAPDAVGGFCFDGVPDGVPGHPELMSQGRDRGVEPLQRVGRQVGRSGSQFRPWPQRVLLGERRSRAARVRASLDAFGPQQPHRLAETRNVMEPDLAASVADRYDAALRTTCEFVAGFDAQNQTGPGCCDGMDVDALDTEQRVCTRAPAAMGTTRHRVMHVRVSFGFGCLVVPIQRGPDLSPAAPRRSVEYLRDGAILRPGIDAYLRRPVFPVARFNS